MRTAIFAATLFLLVSCGGGSGNTPPLSQPPPSVTALDWDQGDWDEVEWQ